MSEDLGPLSYAKDEEHIFLGREIAQHRDYSEDTAKKIDEEVKTLIQESYDHAKEVLLENLDILHALSDLLLEKETVMGAELDELIHAMRPGIELPSKSVSERAKEDTRRAEQHGKSKTDDNPEADATHESEPDPETGTDPEPDIDMNPDSDPKQPSS
jgi:cell division protease FtsH